MKMKALLIVTLSLLMVGLPVFAAGAGTSADQKVEIRCGAGTVGGVFFVMAAAVSTIVNKYVPEVNFTAQTTSGGAESYNRLIRQGLEAYISNGDIPYIGRQGGDPDFPTFAPSTNVRTWFVTEASPFLLVARADNNRVTRFEDLWSSGMRVGTQPLGTGTHVLLLRISAFMGHDSSRLNLHTGGHDQSTNALRDRNTDLIFAGSGSLSAPNSAYQDLAAGVQVRMFDWPETLRDWIVSEMPYWGKFTLEPGWLRGHDRPTNVVGIINSFFLEESVPDDIVYKMTAAVFDNLDELKEIAYAPFRTLNRQTAAANAVVPIHPGALRYYREHGFDVSFLE